VFHIETTVNTTPSGGGQLHAEAGDRLDAAGPGHVPGHKQMTDIMLRRFKAASFTPCARRTG